MPTEHRSPTLSALLYLSAASTRRDGGSGVPSNQGRNTNTPNTLWNCEETRRTFVSERRKPLTKLYPLKVFMTVIITYSSACHDAFLMNRILRFVSDQSAGYRSGDGCPSWEAASARAKRVSDVDFRETTFRGIIRAR